LPSKLSHVDKELHAIFYFLAAAFLNILFANKKIILHVSIFIFLFLFGVAIEFAQEYSNKIFHKRIHGRFDPADIRANLIGLILFSIFWTLYTVIMFFYKRVKFNKQKIIANDQPMCVGNEQ